MSLDLEAISEGEVLRLAQQGDSAALEFLYRRHRPRVYSMCLRMVKNPAQAEDLTQDTFVAVLRGIRNFRGQSTFSTWLHRVTRNTVLMGFRKRRVAESSLDEMTSRDFENSRPFPELGVSDARLESIPERVLLQDAVRQLSRGFRATLLLHDLHGYEHNEVAALLGCATGTSKSQLHKARLRVRNTINKRLRYGRVCQALPRTAQSSAAPSRSDAFSWDRLPCLPNPCR